MAAKGRGIFPYMAIYGYSKTLLTLYRPHLLSDLHETWQKIHPNNIFDEFENDASWLKNMAARRRGNPYMAIIKNLVNTLEATFIFQLS